MLGLSHLLIDLGIKLDFNLSVLHLIKSNVRGVRKLYLCNLGTGIRFFSLLSSWIKMFL